MTVYRGSGDVRIDRRFDMALQLQARGDVEAAADLMAQTCALAPAWPVAAFHLGTILMQAGRRDEAVRAFTRYLTLEPADIMGAVIKLTLLGAMESPPSLPAGYVESLFDDYAPRFEQQLLGKLGYNVPQQLAAMIEALRPTAASACSSRSILDLGCGTGLAGEIWARHASRLEGIDLSAGMLAEAARKQVYHQLHHADMLDFLQGPSRHFDLVIAADVLIYCGALEALFAALPAWLVPGGLLALSIQESMVGDYVLGPDHRYSHHRAYLEQCAEKAGFKTVSMRRAILRQDAGHAVYGWLALFERNSTSTSLPAGLSEDEARLLPAIAPVEPVIT